MPTADEFYTASSCRLQDENNRKLADAVARSVADDELRPEDEGRAEAEGGTITEEEYQAAVMRGMS